MEINCINNLDANGYFFMRYYFFTMILHKGKTYSIESLNIELPACFKLRYNTIKKTMWYTWKS